MGGLILSTSIAYGEGPSVIEEEKQEAPIFIEYKEEGCGYTRPLKVAGMVGNPPFGWVERHDESVNKELESYGLGRILLDKLVEQLKISYVSTGFLSYNKAIAALKRGEIDLLLASYYRPQDLGAGTSIVYPGYFRNVFTVYFKKGKEFMVNSLSDLEGLKGIVRREEHIYPLIHQSRGKNLDLTQVATAKKAFDILMNDEADYLLGSPYAEEAELRRYKLNNEIIPGSKVLFESMMFFVFSTNSNCHKLFEKFSEALKQEDFTRPQVETMIRQIVDDWGERFRESPGLLEEKEEKSEEENDD